jgi:hypothetical protein
MNDAEYKILQDRIDADCARVAAESAHRREKKAATPKKPRKVSLKKYIEQERCGVIKKDVR